MSGEEMPQSKTVYVSIGNSDDKLSQQQWYGLQVATDAALRDHAHVVHGAWYSLPTSPWQNACWCIEISPDWVEPLRSRLASLAAHYRQDSIAWAVADLDFVEPRRD